MQRRSVECSQQGMVELRSQGKRLVLNDVLFVPNLTSNLISVSKLAEDNVMCTFKVTQCEIFTENATFIAPKVQNVYKLKAKHSNAIKVVFEPIQ